MTEPSYVDERLSLIGVICQYWSYLEHLLAIAIWQFLKIQPEVGEIVTGGLGIKPRATMAVAIAQKTKAPANLVSTLKRCLNDIECLSGERNLAVHGVYGLDEDMKRITARVSRGKFKRTNQDMPVERLGETLQKIVASTERLERTLTKHKFIEGLPDDWKPSLGKSR